VTRFLDILTAHFSWIARPRRPSHHAPVWFGPSHRFRCASFDFHLYQWFSTWRSRPQEGSWTILRE